MKLRIEKNYAVIELGSVNPILSEQNRTKLQSYIQQIIKNPALSVGILYFSPQGEGGVFSHSTSEKPFKEEPFKALEKIHSREKWEILLEEIHELFYLMESSPVSWVAVMNGPCLNNLLELALACDYRIADFSAVFGFSQIPFGLIPFCGGSIRLPRLIGLRRSLKIILNSWIISAKTAYRIGLIHQLTHHSEELEKQTLVLKDKIIKSSSSVSVGSRTIKQRGQGVFVTKETLPTKPDKQYKPVNQLDKFFEIPFIRQILFYREKRKIMKSTKGFYPAPLKALEVIKKTYPATSNLKMAFKLESKAFCDLIVSPTARNLFSLQKALSFIFLNKISTKDKTIQIQKAGVIGAGIMGGGIAHWLAHNGVSVLLKDIHAPSLSSTLKFIHSLYMPVASGLSSRKCGVENQALSPVIFFDHNRSQEPRIALRGFAPSSVIFSDQVEERHKGMWNIRPQMDFSGFRSLDLVIESVVEDLEIKKKVIKEVTKHLSDRCLFATNTSSFSISELAKAHPDPSRFFGLHFFYPARNTPLVEVVRGEQTADSVISLVSDWIKGKGKVPLVVKDRPKWLIHRLFFPLMSEALWLLREGMSIPWVDRVYSSFGFSKGPFGFMDELGLDICIKLVKAFPVEGQKEEIPKEVFEIRPVFLGKKTKAGFYIYNDKNEVKSVNHLIYQDLKIKVASQNISEEICLQRGLYRMVNESAKVLKEQVVVSPAELDLAVVLGMGFPAFRGGVLKHADEMSLKTVIAGLNDFSKTKGDRFAPSPALLDYAETGFYPHSK